MAVGCGVLLLLGALLAPGRSQELSSEEERQALMLKVRGARPGDGQRVPSPTRSLPSNPPSQCPSTSLGARPRTPTAQGPFRALRHSSGSHPLPSVVSRLDSLDAAVHRLNVQFYTMDLRLAQFSQGLAELRGRLAEAQEGLSCLRGRRFHAKCFLIVKQFEGYDGAQELCRLRGGNLAMPADTAELAALRRYLHEAFQPHNWPAWVGIHDRRAEGLWLYENGQRVSFFDWYQDHLVSQPNGGARENCVSLSSDDGKWWDNDCARRMYYVCEYRL
uniref:C-type lectin domain containing 11A n=1 Tax=Chrysemys picta bellii TaxID=8478 RepID=A0A8C3H5M4_CHRPI